VRLSYRGFNRGSGTAKRMYPSGQSRRLFVTCELELEITSFNADACKPAYIRHGGLVAAVNSLSCIIYLCNQIQIQICAVRIPASIPRIYRSLDVIIEKNA
jgi:hypothetical protein